MRILALETTDLAGSVAALEDDNLLAQLQLNRQQRSAQSLAPALVELLEQVGWPRRSVQLVAVAVGPGSFTGLRVGVTTAKTLAYAVGAEVLGVNTLEAIAGQAPPEAQELEVVLDAGRRELFCGSFRRAPGGWFDSQIPSAVLRIEAWLERLQPGQFVSGPVAEKLRPRLPDFVQVVSGDAALPSAAGVGRLAARAFAAGQRGDVWQLAPLYLRPSAAEEKWNQRQAGGAC